MTERRENPELAGIADQDIEPAVAVEKRRRQLVDLDEFAQIERHQGRGAAGARIASSISSRPPTVRAARTTCAPSRAKRTATAAPMPREAPVISAILPASRRAEFRSAVAANKQPQAGSASSDSCTETLPSSASTGGIG